LGDDDEVMTAVLYPVAAHADEAFASPRGRAAREREAGAIAAEKVAFVTEPVGPAYATREAALDALAGRIEDDRPGRTALLAPEDRFVALVEQVEPGRKVRSVTPVFKEGHRWPAPPAPPPTVWRAMISYWRIGGDPAKAEPQDQARKARRRARLDLDPHALRALSRQPLRAVKPQQPLDIGLFETRLPEAPHIVVPDE
jgi:hypothetical protein